MKTSQFLIKLHCHKIFLMLIGINKTFNFELLNNPPLVCEMCFNLKRHMMINNPLVELLFTPQFPPISIIKMLYNKLFVKLTMFSMFPKSVASTFWHNLLQYYAHVWSFLIFSGKHITSPTRQSKV